MSAPAGVDLASIPEPLLRDHVSDKAGNKHDIVVLGHNLVQVRARMPAACRKPCSTKPVYRADCLLLVLVTNS